MALRNRINPSSRLRLGSLWAASIFLVLGHCAGREAIHAQEAVRTRGLPEYAEIIQPLLAEYCYGCHGDGAQEGGFSLDSFGDGDRILDDHETWSKVLKNVRANVMPPTDELRPTPAEVGILAQWIKRGPFAIDPLDVDPGRVTIHRLNRLEYQNTIYELLGVRFNANDEFPPDAAGLGLNNIADLLSMSPLIMEKYLDAAEVVLEGAFPSANRQTLNIPGSDIRGDNRSSGAYLSFRSPPEITFTYRNTVPGTYQIKLNLNVVGLSPEERREIADYLLQQQSGNRTAEAEDGQQSAARSRFGNSRSAESETEPQTPITQAHFVATVQSGTAQPQIIFDTVLAGESDSYEFIIEQEWSVDPHKINFNVVMPGNESAEASSTGLGRSRTRRLPAPHIELTQLSISQQPTTVGQQYFGNAIPLPDAPELHVFVQSGIKKFGLRAMRRPLDQATIEYLSGEVIAAYQQNSNFYESLKPELAKLLCSPRFLFRMDQTLPAHENAPWGLVDEFSLASRLSFFLWSGPPDDELLALAERGELRQELRSQVDRMLAHDRLHNFVENFAGQWLQTQNVMNWSVVESAILQREGLSSDTPWLTENIRHLLKQEVFLFFEYVLKEDRSVLDFIDSDYTFLNAELADYYNMSGCNHPEMKLFKLSDRSSRGGLLTAGSTLLVTSTSNRTSPVKRGVFVLDNFLGLRPHDPPPDIPSVDAAAAEFKDHEPTFREMLELHRKDALCASCHNLMDPIGLGLDGFNALGWYRETEFGQPIDTAGKLASGEEFSGIKDLKAILRSSRRKDFYRCLTSKMLTYALGRGLEYYDTESVDLIVDRLDEQNGRFSALLTGIIESSPFQKQRNNVTPAK